MPVPLVQAVSIACDIGDFMSGHSNTAPCSSESSASFMIAAGVAPVCVPIPSQSVHQPSWLLKLKLLGVNVSKLRPQQLHDKCWLCLITFQCCSGISSEGSATLITPLPIDNADSTLSAIREREDFLIEMRSTTISIAWRERRLSAGTSSIP